MDGDEAFGSVGAITGWTKDTKVRKGLIEILGIKNPITAARVVLEQGRPSVHQPLGRVPPMYVAAPGTLS